jgi:hypothetical protein
MNKFTHICQYAGCIFDEPRKVPKAAAILEGILKARSPRLSDIAREMKGGEAGNYKSIQRFLAEMNPNEILLRLFQETASFVIGDPTEMPRPQAKKTDYVGTLSDAETSGYWLLVLATPYHGRALPCGFVDYSSKTINAEASSRNLHHFAAFDQVKELLGERPLVMDREFSYLELMQNLVVEGIHFVIRLKVGALFTDQEGKRVELKIAKGETRILNKVFYRGKIFMNVIGVWQPGFSQPLWVMTDLNAQDGLAMYLQRMKIEESFRDLKSLLGLERLMTKRRDHMQKMVALVMLAYAIGLWLGEAVREVLFPSTCPKRKLYSGLFILLRLKLNLSPPTFLQVSSSALVSFASLVHGVRSNV